MGEVPPFYFYSPGDRRDGGCSIYSQRIAIDDFDGDSILNV